MANVICTLLGSADAWKVFLKHFEYGNTQSFGYLFPESQAVKPNAQRVAGNFGRDSYRDPLALWFDQK
jgi:hypothetical protein